MQEADEWISCRIAFTEVARALRLAGGSDRPLIAEWPGFAVVDIDQALCESATELATLHRLRTLDALHLAAALTVADVGLTLAAWDRRLWDAATQVGLAVLPDERP